MNETQRAAFELRLDDLKELFAQNRSMKGTLVAASSAHDPHPLVQAKVIRWLVEAGVPVNETDKNGVTPLHRAVRFRSLAAVRQLIALGADVNAIDKRSKSTPLHRVATHTGAPETADKREITLEIAHELLSHGANLKIKNKRGKVPFDYVQELGLEGLFLFYKAGGRPKKKGRRAPSRE